MSGFPSLRQRAGRLSYTFKNWFRSRRRQLFLSLRHGDVARDMAAYRRLLAARDWQSALARATALADRAEAIGDRRLMEELAQGLTRMGAYGRAAELSLAVRHIVKGRRPGEWTGQDLTGKTLLVDLMETEKQGLATAIRHAGSVAQAAARATRCIVLVEPRLVPLFARSFPGVDVRAVGDAAAAYREADAFAAEQHLIATFERDAGTIEAAFAPLRPDPCAVAELRASYGGQAAPLVGISWGSSNFGKDLPPLSAWRPLLDGCKAKFVSLQYGPIEADLETLRGDDAGRILHDPSVDQLVDMDRFAAQIAALDAVVTVSNTGAHLAGALGAPMLLVLGDNFKRSWPVAAETTPYYPSARLIWKRRRDWEAVMEEAGLRLRQLLEIG
jgi:hypothetical protein